MRLCIPTADNRGMAGRISPHFGSARYFTLVNTETERVDILLNRHAIHQHGSCRPIEDLAADAVVVRGLGARAFANLQDMNIPVLLTDEWEVWGAVEAFRAGELVAMKAAEACRGRHTV
jgi:predicted Fe-Mo cluster-binding NifX family protein